MNLIKFLRWHYQIAWDSLLRVWADSIRFAFHLFSVELLAKTLFSPWHRIEKRSRKPGFSIGAVFDRLTLNFLSRFIGFCVRTLFIFCGLTLAFIFAMLGLIAQIVWLYIPFFSWTLYIILNPRVKNEAEMARGEAKDFLLKRFNKQSPDEINKIKSEDISECINWYRKLKKEKSEKKKFWKLANLLAVPALGSSLAYGFTPELDQFCENLADEPPFSFDLIGRGKEVADIQSVLGRREQGNALLVGEAGVGKHAILMGLAKAIEGKQVVPGLFYHRALLLHLDEILGSKDSPEEAKAFLSSLLDEAKEAGNIIIVIKNFADYVSDRQKHDLSSVFSRFTHSGKLKFIGVATPSEYERFILPNETVQKFFEKVEVKPATEEEALNLVEMLTPKFEKGKKCTVGFLALKQIVVQSAKLISDIPFPEKALDLLDQLINTGEVKGKAFLDPADVDWLISQKLKIPLEGVSENEKGRLLNLEKNLKNQVFGQDEAVNILVKAMQRSRLGISESSRPMGVFLFLGPTGVGKTETAKALSGTYFGQSKQMVRLDMAEFQGAGAVSAMIGAENKAGVLTQSIRENPYTVLLLDEFEKSTIETKNLFMTVFDEGYLKDANNKKVSFEHAFIICTSNAGDEYIQLRRHKRYQKPRYYNPSKIPPPPGWPFED